ncbi:TOBE domain-containing protein [Desulfovibrio sp. OttesenSCG-928-F07]|nr:TOBE domain-containing protein [Desulfovibrio sp. OttesenSCG-928-F07]
MNSNINLYINNASQSELNLLLASIEKQLRKQGGRSDPELLELLDGTNEKHLDSAKLAEVTQSFASWFKAAATPAQARSRGRVWLVFLLIRYAALRLGEVLALNDSADINFEDCTINVGGQRVVNLPKDITREIANLVNDPMFYSLRGTITHIDPGYLRRKFYEMALSCSLPKELVNPRSLRNSRGVELLNGGLPHKVVQNFMGVQSRQANNAEANNETSNRIVQHYLNREVRMKTSARNVFMGKVSAIIQDNLLVEVELTTLSGLKVVAVITDESFKNLGISKGSVITASVKAPQVILTEADNSLKTSARNKFNGVVSEIKNSSIASEVLVDLYEGSYACALVTNESVKKLELAPRKNITVMFKAFSVILNAE